MLLLKTIWIFLKNKEKELDISNKIIGTIVVVGAIFIFLSVVAVIGYLGLLIEPEMYKGGMYEKYILDYSFKSFLFLVMTGILVIVLLFSCLGGVALGGVALYGVFAILKYTVEWSPQWYRDLKWFIISNWRIAQLQSGVVEKYLIGFNKKDGTTWYLYNSASHLMLYSKEQVIKDLKDVFLVYSRVFFFDKEYAYNGYKLDENFKQLIKKEKLSRVDFGFIKVSDFCKVNKI